jgi:hypothetical protein
VQLLKCRTLLGKREEKCSNSVFFLTKEVYALFRQSSDEQDVPSIIKPHQFSFCEVLGPMIPLGPS